MKTVRCVTIGGWGHWREVLDELAEVDSVELVGVAPAFAGEDLTGLLGHRRVNPSVPRFEDHRAMLDATRPDVAIVSTRLDQIAPAVSDAAVAGCHLICEKPLALDRATLRQLYETVQQHDRQLLAMHTMRSLPAFLAARDAYRDGRIGEVVVANARKSYKWGSRPAWFGRRDVYGGTIPWIGVHALDMIHFVTGRHFTQVTAMHGNRTQPEFPECEDHAVLLARLAGGGHVSASIDFCRPDSAATHGDDWIRVVGSRGVVEANASAGWCRLIETGKAPIDLPLPPQDRIFRKFLDCLAQNAPSGFTTLDSFMLTDVALAARDAADGGEYVALGDAPWGQ